MGLSSDEQEVHIGFGRNDKVAKVYASDTRYIYKLDKLVENNPDFWKCTGTETVKGEVIGKSYECPISLISLRSKKVSRVITEEQKEEFRQRMSSLRS